MLRSAHLGKEIVVIVANKIGILADISRIAADHGLNIEAVAGYEREGQAHIMLITNDNLRASDALKKSGYSSTKEREVVVVELENKAGAMKYVTGTLAAQGIDIKHVYGTTCTGSCPAKIVLFTSDNEKALVAFKK